MFGMYVSELKLDPRLVHVCDFVIFRTRVSQKMANMMSSPEATVRGTETTPETPTVSGGTSSEPHCHG